MVCQGKRRVGRAVERERKMIEEMAGVKNVWHF